MTLPPGRAKLVDQAVAYGVVRHPEDNRDGRCCPLYFNAGGSRRDDDVHFESNVLGCNLGKAFTMPLGPSILDRNGAALDPTEFAQPLHECIGPRAPA